MKQIVMHNADCFNVLPTIADGSVDMVITSPPYNLGAEPWPHLGNWKHGDASGTGSKSKWRNGSDACAGVQYGKHKDAMPWPDYVAWQRQVLSILWEKITDAGAIFYNHKPRVIGGRLWTPLELLPECVLLRQIIVWARPGGMNYNPTAFVPTYEWIMLLAKPAFRLKSKGVSGLGDLWRMNPDANPHPAPFPLELPRKIIDATGPCFVVDPFAGSGTVAVACAEAGCAFIGCEIDKRYYRMALHRIDRARPTLYELAEAPATLFVEDSQATPAEGA